GSGDWSSDVCSSDLIAICNGRYFGAGMHVAPMARLDDGKLDVVSMTAPSKLAFTALSRKMYAASHVGEDGVRHVTCDVIDLTLRSEERSVGKECGVR